MGENLEDPDPIEGEDCIRVREDEDCKVVRRLLDPKLPSENEVENHYLCGHLPFRNWCPVCESPGQRNGPCER